MVAIFLKPCVTVWAHFHFVYSYSMYTYITTIAIVKSQLNADLFSEIHFFAFLDIVYFFFLSNQQFVGFRPSTQWHVVVCACIFELCVFAEKSTCIVYVRQRGKELKSKVC